MSSTTFRKRPVEVEAMQTAPADPMVAEKDREERNRAVARWVSNGGGDVVGFGVTGIDIGTLEGTMTASPGDWIIRGVQGEFYPCKPDIFEATYDRVRDEGLSTQDSPDEAYVRDVLRQMFNGEEPSDGMVFGALALASAAGVPKRRASEIVSEAVQQFGIGEKVELTEEGAAARAAAHERATERFFTASNAIGVVALRDLIVALATEIDMVVPQGRNKSLALTALEDVQMRGNRGIFAPEHLR
jgi:hypothetical protein